MNEPLPDVWHQRDLPVLRAIVRLLDGDEDTYVRTQQIATDLSMDEAEVERAVRNLARGGFLVFPSNAGRYVGIIIDVQGRALTAAGVWPTPETALDRMVAALEEIAQNTDDEDTRTRARKILDGLTGAGKQIGISVATAAITGQLPG